MLDRTPMADGLIAPGHLPETGFVPRVLYPLRGAESLAMVGFMAFTFWFFTILIPEYCLTIRSDAQSLGTPSVGLLVILISAIPVFILLPVFVAYLLQYLGRVLVSSARGDLTPPRMPDRNVEGLITGLGPWLIWILLGLSLSSLPVVWYWNTSSPSFGHKFILILSMIVFGVPYAAISLMLSFLHDNPLAPMPWGVIRSVCQHGLNFMPTLLQVFMIIVIAAGFTALVMFLRTYAYWVYILSAFGWWVMVIWAAMATARILGLHYHNHQDLLRWHHREPRWGVRWRL